MWQRASPGCTASWVAPGFGSRGIDGKLTAIRHAREEGIPFFGILAGMQCAVVEFARNVLGMPEAHSTEIKEYTPDPVIDLMGEQKSITNMGGTMRLGEYPCALQEVSKARLAYGNADEISERHRHRYEFNNAYLDRYEAAGMMATGVNPDTKLVEIVEIPSHPYFVASQFHPEYASTVLNPHPCSCRSSKPLPSNTRSTKPQRLERKGVKQRLTDHLDVRNVVFEVRRTHCDKSQFLVPSLQVALGGDADVLSWPGLFGHRNAALHEFFPNALSALVPSRGDPANAGLGVTHTRGQDSGTCHSSCSLGHRLLFAPHMPSTQILAVQIGIRTILLHHKHVHAKTHHGVPPVRVNASQGLEFHSISPKLRHRKRGPKPLFVSQIRCCLEARSETNANRKQAIEEDQMCTFTLGVKNKHP